MTSDFVTESDLEWWLRFAETLDWTFAKTMPEIPHDYVVRGRDLSDEDFDRAVKTIRTFGTPGQFFGTTRIYLTTEGRRWWTMGSPLEETIIINRDTGTEVYGEQNVADTTAAGFAYYDRLAVVYDARYTSEECRAENNAVWRLVTDLFPHSHPRVLDVGCGTGLALDLGLTTPDRYVGIDPSQGMLNALVVKHPKALTLHAMTAEEFFSTMTVPPTDVVLSLFGSPSYMQPETMATLAEAGRHVVLMHYEEGYLPDYHKPDDVPTADASREAAARLLEDHTGFVTKIGRFDVTVVTR